MIKKIIKVLVILVLLVIVIGLGGFVYLKKAYPKDGPVVDVSINKNDTAMLARGKYLANALMGCVDCHTQRNLDYFGLPTLDDKLGAGGLPFTHDFGFPGTIYSKNITPKGIGQYTDAQIYHTITTGVDTKGEVLFPLMPYTHFSHADPEDLKAVIAYIRTLSPKNGSYPDHDIDFPVNLLIQMTPAPAQPVKKPLTTDTLAYGTYLYTLGACNECHTQREKGEPIPGMELAGGSPFIFKGMGTVRAANITPDNETGIGTWTKDMFIDAFKFYENPEHHKIPWKQKGYQTVMPWLNHAELTRDDLAALYKYLRFVKPVKNRVIKWTPEGEETAEK